MSSWVTVYGLSIVSFPYKKYTYGWVGGWVSWVSGWVSEWVTDRQTDQKGLCFANLCIAYYKKMKGTTPCLILHVRLASGNAGLITHGVEKYTVNCRLHRIYSIKSRSVY